MCVCAPLPPDCSSVSNEELILGHDGLKAGGFNLMQVLLTHGDSLSRLPEHVRAGCVPELQT